MDGMEERRTPGNTLIVQPDKPFQARAFFGLATYVMQSASLWRKEPVF